MADTKIAHINPVTISPKILIVRLGAFGDIIHTLPLAAELHAAGAQVDWLCDDIWASALTDNPIIHRCWPIPRRRWKTS